MADGRGRPKRLPVVEDIPMPDEPDVPSAADETRAAALAAEEPPALRDAFFTLCHALEGSLIDNVPAADHCQEIQAWMTNAGSETDENAVQAWRHVVQLLEGILGQSLTQR